MMKHVLIATDGSDLASHAVDHGLALAKALGAKVSAVTVTEPWTTYAAGEMAIAFPVAEYDAASAENAGRILADVTAAAAKAGIACNAVHVKDRAPSDGIVETAEKLGCDLVVMASHGRRGVSQLLLGSQAYRVVTMSKVPVLICR